MTLDHGHPESCQCDDCLDEREDRIIELLVDHYRRAHGDERAEWYAEQLRRFKRRATREDSKPSTPNERKRER